MTAQRETVKPLDGVNVLDFCWVAVGPMTTKYLGEYGATVVRVESVKRPGTLRRGRALQRRGFRYQPQRLLRQLQRQQDGYHGRHAAPQGPRIDAAHG